MKLPPEAIEEFKQLMKDKYNQNLSNEEAETQAQELMTLFRLANDEPNVLP